LNELTDFNPFSDRFPQTLSMSAIGRLNQCCCVKLVCVLWQTEWLSKSYKAACLDPHSAVKQHIDQCVRPGGKVKPRGAALRSGVCLPVLSGCERAGKGRRFPGQHLTFTNPTTSLFCYNEHKGSWGGAFSNKRQDEL